MKRLFLLLLGGLALVSSGAFATAAAADPSTPSGIFSAPTRVPGGSAFFVRSVTPCPAPNGAYGMVRIGIEPAGAPAGDPAGVDLGPGTQGWLQPDGSWEVTLIAPSIATDQPTLPFTIQAICIVHTDPYFVNDEDGAPVDNEDLLELTMTYIAKTMWSTSSGGYANSADTKDSTGVTTTTTSTTSTTSTTAPTTTSSTSTTSSTLVPTAYDGGSGGSGSGATSKLDADSVARAAAIRAELQAKGIDTTSMSDVELLASPVATSRPVTDGGLPWWSFVLATLLAVGAVVAWGHRRETTLD
jgi:hypothetical protein